ncbi:BadF/BadG/BcrA/BcrD ATPase family protein [Nonomuraea sp. B10E15]|uniref:N-acetylglucosamine kinase n=1 Tax=Nonomuraea sp. B10E15 TaxID=3153560 RepID=UPI00325EB7E3
MHLVLGVDAGGTSSRAALFTLDGTLVRRGQAGGANPGARGMGTAAANLTAAVRATLADPGPAHRTCPLTGAGTGEGTVVGVVVGLAGNPALCATLTERVLGALLPGADFTGDRGVPGATPVRVTGDIVTAFAAGTPSPSGTVLISGTGAIAARITDHAPAGTADGYGWLLGDEGSAFWIGLAAARATIRALTVPRPSPTRGRAGQGLLADLVLGRLLPDGPGGDPGARLAAAVHARPPLALAELAPLVSEAAMGGDPVAVSIVAEAASRLASTASGVHEPGLPLVLAGGVLTAEGPVRDAVRGLLEGAVTAGDPAGAAAWLAARPLLGPQEAEARHSRFTRPA